MGDDVIKMENVIKQGKKGNSKLGITRRVLLIFISIAIVVTVGIFGFVQLMPGSSGSSDPNPTLFAVKRGDLTISVTESGNIKAVKSEIVKSKVESRTNIVNIVPEGTYITPEDVNNGKVLVELDASNLNEQLPQRKIELASAEASYAEAKEGYDIQVKQSERDIAAAKLKLKFALMDLKKYLGEMLAKKVIEKVSQDPNSSIDMDSLLEDIENSYSGSQAYQKLLELNSNMTLAQENLEKVIYTLSWTERLFKKQFVTETELRKDKLEKKRNEFECAKAWIALNLFKLYEFPKQVEQYLSDYDEANLELERVNARTRSQLAQAKAKLLSTEATLSLQNERLKKVQKQLEACIIKAPAPGQVVYSSSTQRWSRVKIEQGAEVYQSYTIIEIPDTSKMKVEIKIHENWIDKIQVEQKAKITIAAFPDKVFNGKVLKKAPLADPRESWEPDVKVYTTDVSIEGTYDFIKTGMTGKVEVTIDELRDVLYVPIQSVVTVEDKKVCYVTASSESEKREVETGLFNDDFVEIKSGLTEGEKVLLNPPRWTTPESAEKQSDKPAEPNIVKQ
jgi:RND family efflux transporter MFP subunit